MRKSLLFILLIPISTYLFGQSSQLGVGISLTSGLSSTPAFAVLDVHSESHQVLNLLKEYDLSVAVVNLPPADYLLDDSFSLPESSERGKCNFFKSPYAGFVIPVGLITYGVVAQSNPLLQRVNAQVNTKARAIFPGRVHVDDYLQYVPLVTYFGLDLVGVKAKYNFLDRTIIAATSYLIMTGVVNAMKYTIPVLRPDQSAWNSFPSGHTATAFTGAHLLFREYKHISPWIGVAGYFVATTTGVMRMLNRKHWFSDVMTGAGIGIASVELSYLIFPLFDRWIYGKGRRSDATTAMSFTPLVGSDFYGAGFTCVF